MAERFKLDINRLFAPVAPRPAAAPVARSVIPMSGERVACRREKLETLARATEPTGRDAVARLFIVAKCGACGLCADMVAR